ncbi:MAG: MATE family efflux transporter [Muribaculaceae bacterium]|nr:MATE family efflux transporter [Muribaculaceae bacterium]
MGFWGKYRNDYAQIARLGLPILVGQVGMIVVGFADNIMVGRYSTQALASASFVNGVFNTAIFACIGFSYGLTPLVGALFSQGRRTHIGGLMRTGVFVNILFALLVSLLMGVLYLNVDRLDQPEELLPIIRPYFRLYLAGILPLSMFQVFAQWSWGIKNTAMPMWIILGSNVINIIGNWLLIYGNAGMPELGLQGAGISTLTARWLAAIVIAGIFFFKKSNQEYRDGFRSTPISWSTVKQINVTSWPVSLQSTMESASFSIVALMAGWLGALELASFQILIVISTLGFCIYYSIGSAIAVLVSNETGLGNRSGTRRVAFAGYHIMLLLVVTASLLIMILNRHFIAAFTEDAAVITLTSTLIFPLLLYQIGDATQITFANALRGTSNVMPMLWIAFVSYVVIGIPASYTLGFTAGLGLYGLILSFSVSLFSAAAFFLYFFLRTTREKKPRTIVRTDAL